MNGSRQWQSPEASASKNSGASRPPEVPPTYGAPGGASNGSGSWTPPPKPGLIPLRPLAFGTLLGAPFQVLRRNPKATFGSALLIQAVIVLVSLVSVGAVTAIALGRITSASSADLNTVAAGSIVGILVSYAVPAALGLVGSAFLQGIIVLEVARATLGEKLTMKRLWGRARHRLGPLVGWAFILVAAVLAALVVLGGIVTVLVLLGPVTTVIGIVVGIVGVLAGIVLGVWLYTKTSLVPSLIVLESRGIRTAVARSWSLTGGYFWRTFGVQALIAVIVNVVAQVVTTPLAIGFVITTTLLDPTGAGQLNGSALTTSIVLYVVLIVVSLVIGGITSVVQAGAVALIYIDLRMRKEGLDLDLVRFVEARETDAEAADPFAPTVAQAVPEQHQDE